MRPIEAELGGKPIAKLKRGKAICGTSPKRKERKKSKKGGRKKVKRKMAKRKRWGKMKGMNTFGFMIVALLREGRSK